MIFHHPQELGQGNGQSASVLRPQKMHQAFCSLGYDPILVVGSSKQRKAKIDSILKDESLLASVDFLYSELTTMPMALSDPHHLPIRPDLDFHFFQALRTRGIGVSVFYRDIHWKMESYGEGLAWWKKKSALWFYQREKRQLEESVDKLFLPSHAMNRFLGYQGSLADLPPGCDDFELDQSQESEARAPVQLLYVGGIAPPIYDLTSLLQLITATPQIKLSIVCREQEWHKYRDQYSRFINDQITILHRQHRELQTIYREADFLIHYQSPYFYNEFGMPFKVFESLSYEVPVIVRGPSAIAEFVEKEKCGFQVSSDQELAFLLQEIVHKDSFPLKDVKKRNLWSARAQKVVDCLQN